MLISVLVGSVRGGSVGHLIESILKQDYPHWELRIAAQGNDAQLLREMEQAKARDQRISYLHLQRFGRSQALNALLPEAKGDIIAFTDDDCEAAPDWLSTIGACFKDRPEVGIVAGDLVAAPAQRKWTISTCPAAHTIEYVYQPSASNYRAPDGWYWIGGNVAVRRTALERIGLFDEYLGVGTEFPAAEDVDYCLRAEALDIAMWTTPRSVVYHTYGRRYGLKQALKHHRGYALGSGALNRKLELWGHRLYKKWKQHISKKELLRLALTNPARFMLELYHLHYRQLGYLKYAAAYEPGPDLLTRPLSLRPSTPRTPAAG